MRSLPFIAITLSILFVRPAFGRSHRDLAYQRTIIWNSVVRLLRVDLGFDLVERDQEAGYVLFRYVEGPRSHPGSLELVDRSLPDGRQGVRVVVSVPAMPTYIEQHIIDRLRRKLLEEIGPPMLPRPAKTRPENENEEQEKNTPDKQRGGEKQREQQCRTDPPQ